MKRITFCLILVLFSLEIFGQRLSLRNPLKPEVDIPSPKLPKLPKVPKITIDGKIFEPITTALQNVINESGKLIPKEVEKISTKLFGESAKLSGNLVDIYRANNKKITGLTLKGMDLYQQILEPVNENVLKLKDGTLNAVGITLPKEIDNGLDDYISLQKDGFNELYTLYEKTLEIEDNALDKTSTGLKEFGKYLLLSTNGFPKPDNVSPLNKQLGIATVNIAPSVLQIILNNLIDNEYRTADDRSKPFQVITISSSSLKFDNTTNSLILELNDSKIRHNQPLGFSRISGTLNIKKLKLQILPFDNQDGSVTFKTKLFYLDVEDMLPKLDQMLCWALEENIISKITSSFKASELINSKYKVQNSNREYLNLATTHFENKVFIAENQLGVVYKSDNINTDDVSTRSNSLEVKFSPEFLKSILNKSLAESNGIKISIAKNAKNFDETKNHVNLKKINNITFNKDGSMYLGVEGSVHFRRFLGKKPKVNVLFSNVGFNLIPVLSSGDSSSFIFMTLIPVIDSLTVTGSPVKAKVLRKVAKLFKLSKTPIELDKASLGTIKNFNFINPLNNASMLLPTSRELKLIKGTEYWQFGLDFK